MEMKRLLLVELGLAAAAADGAETLLELVDAAFGVHKLVLAGEERVGIGGDTAGNHEMLNPVDNFRLCGTGWWNGSRNGGRWRCRQRQPDCTGDGYLSS